MAQHISETVKLNNGVEMPWLGLGVWRSMEGEEVANAVGWALEAGYSSVDTAAIYQNEKGVGRAIKESGINREDIFITTKLWNNDQRSGNIREALETSLDKLGADYIDLYLIHWPVQGKFTDCWLQFESLYQEGKIRAIGISNFHVPHLEQLLEISSITPAVNQVEFHPYLLQPELISFCSEHKIQLQAWAPLMQGKINEVTELEEIGEKHGKSPAQIALRWNLQHRVITIPKSVNQDRIKANVDIFDFSLSDEDISIIDSLDRNYRFGPDPDNFDF